MVAFCVPANSNGTLPSSARALRDVALLKLGDERLQPELVQDHAVAVHPVRPLQAELVALAVGVIYLRIQVPERASAQHDPGIARVRPSPSNIVLSNYQHSDVSL